MISYAHNRKVGLHGRVFGAQPAGFYTDVGAVRLITDELDHTRDSSPGRKQRV